jgi:triphosphoribosyl-dephospho-CoA synthase
MKVPKYNTRMHGQCDAIVSLQPLRLTAGHAAELACLLEATARKAGNVTRFADFDDLTYCDLLLSATVIRPIFERVTPQNIGATVLDAVRSTRQVCRGNSNLGLILALAPLAAAEQLGQLGSILRQLTLDDSRAVFEAIRLAQPGGLGEVPEQDVRHEPTLPLRDIMVLAAERDLIARQYARDFRDVLEIGVPTLRQPPKRPLLPPFRGRGDSGTKSNLEEAIVACHLRLLAELGDSQIERRWGRAVSEEARRQASDVLAGRRSWGDFDAWLRAAPRPRNPGSTADLTAASLFVALRWGMIEFPFRFYASL